MKEVILDGKLMTTKAKLHKEMKNKLDLPEYYGNNLDALWDMLTGYVEMPLKIIIINFNVCKKALGDYAEDLLFVFEQVEKELDDFILIVKNELKDDKTRSQDFCDIFYTDRIDTNSVKWDNLKETFGNEDLIPMWVADMDFESPEAVRIALKERINHNVYGYSIVPESYYKAFINWEEIHHSYKIKKEWIRLASGVVPAIYWFINAFTRPNDSIIILLPVYYPFQNAIKNTNRNLVTCELINDNGYYKIDFDEFERSIVENKVKMFIQSSPHNPVGRVWSMEEQDKILKICKDNGVLVISDEIHQDIILNGHKHIPAATVKDGYYADNIITITSASKTFNLAALNTANMIIESPEIRQEYDDYIKTISTSSVNLMGIIATQAAYNYGEEWLSDLLLVLEDNYKLVKESFNEFLPKIVVSPLEGTYLVWIDLREYVDRENIKEFIEDKCGIGVDYGEWFSPLYKGFIRLNIATRTTLVRYAVQNIIDNINK
ncbi:MAG: PatB family C-S lyase [Oscillospiraceae bacterium]|nr:PatB family C-S lyase [Oscillospiraceae bacterium]